MTEELEPCPFAHDVKRGPFLEIDTDFCFVRVSCSDCGCAGPFVTLDDLEEATAAEKAEVVTLWNTRTDQPPPNTDLTDVERPDELAIKLALNSICGVGEWADEHEEAFIVGWQQGKGAAIAAMHQQPVHADEVEWVARAIFDSHNATYTAGGPAKWESDPEHWRRYARAALLVSNRSGVEAAYREGHRTGRCGGSLLEEDDDWEKSKARTALDTEKEK